MIPIPLLLYIRYVDDIALALPMDVVDNTLELFNSFHPTLKFTVEIAGPSGLNFLDVTMIKHNKTLEFNWYLKPTFSRRYLNYSSHHPLC